MNYSKISNPYDFANPVSKSKLFAGRADQLTEIIYYLDYARKAPKPINLAIMGQRASGKTSLLNMIHVEAQNRGICVARVDLDEGDAQYQLSFFYKLFDCILTSACESGAFGGSQGKTYQSYLEMSNTYVVPQDKTFCSFFFPMQYAYAMQQNNLDLHVTDHNLKKDLSLIYQELKCPIIILFDESNVLTKNKILMEKMRNIFMNLEGYMLVLTGTPDLFPLIDTVFSPLIRQFKKIVLSAYESIEETSDCITKPIDMIGLPHYTLISPSLIREIHLLSDGRPYEIQLICHFLFRQVQRSNSKSMRISLKVLEEIRDELFLAADLQNRPIINQLRKLHKTDLKAINYLCCCDGHASFEELWNIEYIFNGEKHWTKASLQDSLNRLISYNFIKIDNDIIRFSGDYFDKLYVKYFSAEKGIPVNFIDNAINVYWKVRLDSGLRQFEYLSPIKIYSLSDKPEDLLNLAKNMADETAHHEIFIDGPPLVQSLYKLMLSHYKDDSISILTISLELPFFSIHTWYLLDSKYKSDKHALNYLRRLSNNVTRIGGKLTSTTTIIPMVPVNCLRKKIMESSSDQLRQSLSGYHMQQLFESYTKECDLKKALFYANLALDYNPTLVDAPSANNIGYLYLLNKQPDQAKAMLNQGLSLSLNYFDTALLSYNLGIAELLDNNFSKAIDSFMECKNNLAQIETDGMCACLITPLWNNGLDFCEELNDPTMLVCANKAIEVSEMLLQQQSNASSA